jgi:multidrug efflux pump subunit AcrB
VYKAQLRVVMSRKHERAEPLAEILEGFRAQLAEVPGLQFRMREAGLGDASLEEQPVMLFVRGPDYAELAKIANQVVDAIKRTPGARDAMMNYQPGAVEQRLTVDSRAAADRGVNFGLVAMTLRTALAGQEVTKLKAGEDDIAVRVVLREEDRTSMAALQALTVPTPVGMVALSEVTQVVRAATPSTIERQDRQRQIGITAGVYGRTLGEVVTDLEARLEAIETPPGYVFQFAGEAERMQETADNMGLAMALAVLFIYFVLASQFESFVHPLTIMLALPMAIVGAIIGLFITGQAMGMPSMIGMILLMGLVTKNSILLVDYTQQLRARGLAIKDALAEAGMTRLRPILMTSAAIVLGMLPSALATGEGSEFHAPMAIAVIGGVITSTLLTLIVVPVVYVWLDRFTIRGFREWRADRRARKAADKGAPPAVAAEGSR